MDFRKNFIDFAKSICPQNELGCYAALFLYMMTPWPISSMVLITLLVGYATLGLENLVDRSPVLAYALGLNRESQTYPPAPSEGVGPKVEAEREMSREVESDKGFVNISLNNEQTDRESAEDPDQGFKMFDPEYRKKHGGNAPK